MNRLGGLLGTLALVLVTSSAGAALTSSEKGQVRDFVVAAKVESAHRVRSLVARTDLSQEESISVLSDAVSAAPFTAERATYLHELVFGPASDASRPLLALATTRAALARADTVFQKYVGGLDHEPKALAELASIYAFLDRSIADAGRSKIAPSAWEQCGKAVVAHVDRNARWLKGDAKVPDAVNRLRAQAQVLVYDLAPDGLTRRVDVADRLGLAAARKKLLVDTGILLADGGKLDETKVGELRAALARAPALTNGIALLYVGGNESGAPIVARGAVATTTTSGAEKPPFGAEVTEAPYDPSSSAALLDLSVLAARRALAKPELRARVEADAANAKGDRTRLLGRPRGPGLEHVLGAAMFAVLVDTPRAVDSALARMLQAKPEAAALLSDAVGALATEGEDKKLTVAGSKPLTDVQLSNGVAVGFTLNGKKWRIDRAAPSFAVTGATVDGRVVAWGDLATAKPPKK